MKIHKTYNVNIILFDDITCHLKLEEEHFEASRVFSEAYEVVFGHDKASNSK